MGLIQGAVGCLYYSKSMRVGTYILALSAVQLIYVGPSDAENPEDPVGLVSKPLAVGWLTLMAALNNSLNKVISEVPLAVKVPCLLLYIFMGNMSTVFQAWGNASLNNGLSVPCFSCVQVLLNGLTGIFIWGDLDRTEHWLAY